MKGEYIEHKVDIMAHSKPVQIPSKYHNCAFNWYDKCAFCDLGYDDLKIKISSSLGQTDDLLKAAVDECLLRLEGYCLNMI